MTITNNYTDSGSFIRRFNTGRTPVSYLPETTTEEGETTPEFPNPFEANISSGYVEQGPLIAANAPVKGAAPKKATPVKKKVDPKATTPASTQPLIDTYKTTPGTAIVIPIHETSTTTKDSTGTTEKVGGSKAEILDLYKTVKQKESEGSTRQAEVDKTYGTDIERLGQQRKIATDQKSALADKLFDYTKQLDRNQEAEFWNKIIGGLGRMVAGGVGLATDLDVGGQYKEPAGMTAEELNKPATAKFGAETANIKEGAKQDVDLLSAIQKYKDGQDMTMKEYTAFGNMLQRDPSFMQKIQQKSTETTESTKDRVLEIPATKVDTGKDPKLQKKAFLNKVPYFAAITATNQNFGNFEPSIQGVDGPTFGRAFKTALQTWSGGGKGFSTPDADKIGKAYENLIRNSKMTPAEARQAILTDFQNVMQVQPAKSDSWETLNERALMYGLPYGLLEPKFGASYEAALGVAPAAPAVVPQPGAAQGAKPSAPAQQGSFKVNKNNQIEMYVDGKLFKTIPYSDAKVKELKEKAWRLVEQVKK